jgi:hypothetical protein
MMKWTLSLSAIFLLLLGLWLATPYEVWQQSLSKSYAPLTINDLPKAKIFADVGVSCTLEIHKEKLFHPYEGCRFIDEMTLGFTDEQKQFSKVKLTALTIRLDQRPYDIPIITLAPMPLLPPEPEYYQTGENYAYYTFQIPNIPQETVGIIATGKVIDHQGISYDFSYNAITKVVKHGHKISRLNASLPIP